MSKRGIEGGGGNGGEGARGKEEGGGEEGRWKWFDESGINFTAVYVSLLQTYYYTNTNPLHLPSCFQMPQHSSPPLPLFLPAILFAFLPSIEEGNSFSRRRYRAIVIMYNPTFEGGADTLVGR